MRVSSDVRGDLRFALVHFLLFVGVALLPLSDWPLRGYHGDMFLYHRWSSAVFAGSVPYVDFSFEYPPAALAVFALPQLVGGGRTSIGLYAAVFLFLNAGVSALLAVRLSRFAALRPSMDSRRTRRLYTALVLLIAPLIAWRYDAFPAACAILGVLAAIEGRAFGSGVWLALGVALKLFPAILMPAVALLFVVRRSWTALGRFAGAVVLSLVICFAPALLLAGDRAFSFIEYHRQRSLGIESLPAGAIVLARTLPGGEPPPRVIYNFGAAHLRGDLARRVASGTPIAALVFLSFVVSVSAVAFRRIGGDGEVILATATLIAGFIVMSKVFSPQFVFWLAPVLALLPVAVVSPFASLALAGLTGLSYPFFHDSLRHQELGGLIVINLRNGVLVWIALCLGCRLWLAATGAAPVSRQPARGGSSA